MLKKLFIPIIILLLALVFFKWMLMSKDKTADIEFKEHVWRVEQTIIEKQTLSPGMTLYGKIESSELLNAAAPAASQVEKVLIKEGQFIEKDQLMLVLDQADFEPVVKQAQGKVNELKALIKSEQLRHEFNINSLASEKKLLKLSEQALSRSEKVKSQNLGSISETDQAMQQFVKQRLSYNLMQFSVNEHSARMEQLQARLLQAEADLLKSHLALKRSKIIAPFNGIVAKVNVARGDRVNGNEKLLSFYSLERLEIRAKLPISILHEIQQNLINGKALKGTASIGGRQISVLLERLSGEGQASGVDAIFSVLAPNSAQTSRTYLRIGSIAVVNLQRAAQKNLIKVPFQAMYGADRLYKIVDKRLQSVKVESIGEYQQNEQVQLLIKSDELHSGDVILSTHLPNAFSGLKVKTIAEKNSVELTDQ
ncbi:MAG: biotin/lipoyl-binding protein [gamma proteobacterium symbiont of Taylorina sp.]|nr:biotin/lipoyl-binding protein [gamma proteobacterium symbiont of Taylorina sp.]